MTLRDARTALGWSQVKLAAKSGVLQQVISDLERDPARASVTAHGTLMRLVLAFQAAGMEGLTVEQLFPINAPAVESTEAAS